MKCPYCGNEIADGSAFCSFCGAQLSANVNAQSVSNADFANNYKNESSANISAKSNDNDLTPENFRDKPTYKPNLIKLNIFGAVMFTLFGLSMLGSLLARFSVNAEVLGYCLLAACAPAGLVIFFAFFLPTNKKVFPQVNGIKMKGILEVLPAIWTALGMAMFVVALVIQGLILMIY